MKSAIMLGLLGFNLFASSLNRPITNDVVQSKVGSGSQYSRDYNNGLIDLMKLAEQDNTEDAFLYYESKCIDDTFLCSQFVDIGTDEAPKGCFLDSELLKKIKEKDQYERTFLHTHTGKEEYSPPSLWDLALYQNSFEGFSTLPGIAVQKDAVWYFSTKKNNLTEELWVYDLFASELANGKLKLQDYLDKSEQLGIHIEYKKFLNIDKDGTIYWEIHRPLIDYNSIQMRPTTGTMLRGVLKL